jgi:chromosome partitioning protein
MGKIIAITNHKGGVGKTSITLNLGLALAHRGAKVVMVDADAQGTLTEGLGLPQSPGLYDALVREASYDQVITPIPQDNYAVGAIAPKGWAGIIRGNNETRHIAESISQADAVLERFEGLKNGVDYIIFDMSPTESLLHPVIYVACDAVIHPTLCEDWSVKSLRRTIGYVKTAQVYRRGAGLPETYTLGIVPNQYRDTGVHQAYLEAMQEEFSGLVRTPIRQRIVWSEAATFHQPVFAYDPISAASADVWGLADMVEGVTV